MLGGALYENMLVSALDEKLCWGRREAKAMRGVALDKNMLGAALGKKLCLDGRQLKNTGCCIRQKYSSSSVR